MADQDIRELRELTGAFSELSGLIPTEQFERYQQTLGTIAVEHQLNRREVDNLTRSIANLTQGTTLSQQRLASISQVYSETTNRSSLSLQQFQKIAVETSKIDPFNSEQRTRGILQFTKQFGSLTAGLSDGSKRSDAALRLMVLAINQGDDAMSNFFRTMSEGRDKFDNFTTKQMQLAAVLENTRKGFGGFVGDSKLVGSGLDLLQRPMVSTIASLGLLYLLWTKTRGLRGFITGEAEHGGAGVGNVVSSLAAGGRAGIAGVPRGAAMPRGVVGKVASFFGVKTQAERQAAERVKFARESSLTALEAERPVVGRLARVESAIRRGAGKLGGGTVIAGALTAFEFATARTNQGRAEAIGGGVGAVALGGLATLATGNPLIGIAASIAGDRLGRLIADKFVGPVEKSAEDQVQSIAGKLQERLNTIRDTQKAFAGAVITVDPLQQRERMISVQRQSVQQLSSLGMIGPAAQIDVARQAIQLYAEQIAAVTKEFQEGKRDSTEYAIAIGEIQNKQLEQVKIARRSIIEQFTAGAMNFPRGSFTMPGTLSPRQLYGSSYYDFAPLSNIRDRPQQPKYQDFGAAFMPLLKQISDQISKGQGVQIPGHAEGGLIPGPPSTRDNTLTKVASGEYVIRTQAVQHYGVPFFEKLNKKALKHFAVGGMQSSPYWQSSYTLPATRPVGQTWMNMGSRYGREIYKGQGSRYGREIYKGQGSSYGEEWNVERGKWGASVPAWAMSQLYSKKPYKGSVKTTQLPSGGSVTLASSSHYSPENGPIIRTARGGKNLYSPEHRRELEGFWAGGMYARGGMSKGQLSAVASGEYIVNAGAVQHYGSSFLDRVNKQQVNREQIKGYATGGLVYGSSFAVGGMQSQQMLDEEERKKKKKEAPFGPYLPGIASAVASGYTSLLPWNLARPSQLPTKIASQAQYYLGRKPDPSTGKYFLESKPSYLPNIPGLVQSTGSAFGYGAMRPTPFAPGMAPYDQAMSMVNKMTLAAPGEKFRQEGLQNAARHHQQILQQRATHPIQLPLLSPATPSVISRLGLPHTSSFIHQGGSFQVERSGFRTSSPGFEPKAQRMFGLTGGGTPRTTVPGAPGSHTSFDKGTFGKVQASFGGARGSIGPGVEAKENTQKQVLAELKGMRSELHNLAHGMTDTQGM